jgi:hypothetical protein
MQCNNMPLCLGNISVQLLEGIRQHSLSAASSAHIRMKMTDKHQNYNSHRITEAGLADKFN